MSTLVFMFPGQSSRYPGMLSKLARLHRRAGEVLALASDAVGRDLAAHLGEDNPAAFERNVDVQVGVFVANHMVLCALQAEGIDAERSLGLSLGEYNHLVHIGALDFLDALRLVQARGDAYDAGPRGAMASVQPIELEALEEVVERVRAQGPWVLEIVNLNSPRQHVLSGDAPAIDAAIALLEDEHYVTPQVIERQVPMHSSLFEPVGAALRPHLGRASFRPPRLPYLPNRLGDFIPAPGPTELVDLLAEHVHTPVLWRKSIDRVVERHPGAIFVEVGARQVLHNLLDRKWHSRPRYFADSREAAGEHWSGLVTALRQHLPPPPARGVAQEASWTG